MSNDIEWWNAIFIIDWPENSDPKWHVDVMIAHLVIKKILDDFEDKIKIWRFHRRASKEGSGKHEFSFIFYTTQQEAEKINKDISNNEILNENNIIKEYKFDDIHQIKRPNIEDGDTDPKWPPYIKKSWPYYIMGVSKMWLELINDVYESKEDIPSSLEDKVNFYKEINNKINNIWQNECCHPILHHVNAVFGYVPIKTSSISQMYQVFM